MDMEMDFYLGTHMKCAGAVTFILLSTVSRKSDSSSEANSSCCHRSDAW